jgi:hypothetical protein
MVGTRYKNIDVNQPTKMYMHDVSTDLAKLLVILMYVKGTIINPGSYRITPIH